MNNTDILIIDDEAPIRKLLGIILGSNEYKVDEAVDATEGLMKAAHHPPDLILLDIGLPDENGHTVLKKLREWYTKPIIILSVERNEEDMVKALDNGANDYLVKPFRTGELLARIRAALKSVSTEEREPLLQYESGLRIDLSSRTVKKKDQIIKCTSTEYALLTLLAKNSGRVLTHQFLLKEIWGPAYVDQSQYLRVFIAQLRKKIEDDPNRPAHILTESGVGYRFVGE